MKTRTWHAVLLAVLALCAAVLVSCESTDALAPEGSELTVSASPSEVIIDLEAGEDRGQAIIEARVFTGAFPLEGVAVTFDTDGGVLATSDNHCGSGGQCVRTGGSCASDSDCPALAPSAVETDSNGVARDTLTLTLADPASVEVTARSGAKSASVSVSKTIAAGNQPPEAVIVADPADEQRSGQPVIFDGSDSSDPDGIITCYQWVVNSGTPMQGTALTQISPTFNFPLVQLPQTVVVVLRVSDDPGVSSQCQPGLPAVPANLFRGLDTINYTIVCDPTGPELSVPGTINAPAGGAAFVDVTLEGTAEDPESGLQPGSAEWSCGDASGFVAGATRICRYTSNADWVARFRASNTCGETTDASVTVRVTGIPNPPNAP
jgi:hypothetical protein